MDNQATKLAESVMKAAGSSLKHYMPASKERIIAACQEGIDKAEGDLLDAAEKMNAVIDKFSDYDEGCFYYNQRAASELYEPFILLKSAIAKAKGA